MGAFRGKSTKKVGGMEASVEGAKEEADWGFERGGRDQI